jgi:sec-independent protein translocase protein TatA
MGALSPTHWLIILLVVVILFGAKRLPDAARSLGRSARILKAEMTEVHNDSTPQAAASEPAKPTERPAADKPSTNPA